MQCMLPSAQFNVVDFYRKHTLLGDGVVDIGMPLASNAMTELTEY
jgi:hypothetical protein